MYKNIDVLLLTIPVLLTACGGGSSPTEDVGDTIVNDETSLMVGVFVDSPVAGADYVTQTQSGITNSDGEFNYLEGESVTFSIGETLFPTITASHIVSPVDMAGAGGDSEAIKTNIARFLQSIDSDGDSTNGITVPSGAALSSYEIDFNQSIDDFADNVSVINMIANSGSSNTSLIDAADALRHLNSTLGIATTDETDNVDVGNEVPSFTEPTMLDIPGGAFTMGCLEGRDDFPSLLTCGRPDTSLVEVNIQAFKLSATEVTLSDWSVCLSDGACNGFQPDDHSGGVGDHPVHDISWDDAQSFVDWLREKTGKSYRLPSESEWEYASRGGSNSTAYSWGSAIGVGNANCYSTDSCGDSYSRTSPVASFSPNNYGLYDMHGNSFEWVQDCWHDSYVNAPTDGAAWDDDPSCSRRVLRDGGYAEYYQYLSSASRRGYNSSSQSGGLRLALDD